MKSKLMLILWYILALLKKPHKITFAYEKLLDEEGNFIEYYVQSIFGLNLNRAIRRRNKDVRSIIKR